MRLIVLSTDQLLTVPLLRMRAYILKGIPHFRKRPERFDVSQDAFRLSTYPKKEEMCLLEHRETCRQSLSVHAYICWNPIGGKELIKMLLFGA
jgi:hypothetical protein